MELEEMQKAWSQMSGQLEQQKKLTDDLILKMTKQNYTSLWDRVAVPEKIGFAISYIAMIALLAHFDKLDTIPLRICGWLCVLILAIPPIMSLRIIGQMKQVDFSGSYIETITAFAKAKKRYINFQKSIMVISFVFMILTIPVSSKLLNGKDLFEHFDAKLYYVLPVCFLCFGGLVFIANRCYRAVLRRSNAIIEETKKED